MGYLASDAKLMICGALLWELCWWLFIPFAVLLLYTEAKAIDASKYVKAVQEWALVRIVYAYLPAMLRPKPAPTVVEDPNIGPAKEFEVRPDSFWADNKSSFVPADNA